MASLSVFIEIIDENGCRVDTVNGKDRQGMNQVQRTLHAAKQYVKKSAAKPPDFTARASSDGTVDGLDWAKIVDFCQRHVDGCHVKHVELKGSHPQLYRKHEGICDDAAKLTAALLGCIDNADAAACMLPPNEPVPSVTLTVALHREPPHALPDQVALAAVASKLAYSKSQEVKTLASHCFDEVVMRPTEHDAGRVVLSFRHHADRPDEVYVAFRGSVTMDDAIADISARVTTECLGVHAGFLKRSQVIGSTLLQELMSENTWSKGHNVILCGHSLGGAAAAVRTLSLLITLHPELCLAGRLRCIGFGAPLFASEHAAKMINDNPLWRRLFTFVVAENDPVPAFLASRRELVELGTNAKKEKLAMALTTAMFPQASGKPDTWKKFWNRVAQAFESSEAPAPYHPAGVFVSPTDLRFDASGAVVQQLRQFKVEPPVVNQHLLNTYLHTTRRYLGAKAATEVVVATARVPENPTAQLTAVVGAKAYVLTCKGLPLLPYSVELIGGSSGPRVIAADDATRQDTSVALAHRTITVKPALVTDDGDVVPAVERTVLSLRDGVTRSLTLAVPSELCVGCKTIAVSSMATEHAVKVDVAHVEETQFDAKLRNQFGKLIRAAVVFHFGTVLNTPKTTRQQVMSNSLLHEPLRSLFQIVGLSNKMEDLTERVIAAEADAAFKLESELISDRAKEVATKALGFLDDRMELLTDGITPGGRFTGLMICALIVGASVSLAIFPPAATIALDAGLAAGFAAAGTGAAVALVEGQQSKVVDGYRAKLKVVFKVLHSEQEACPVEVDELERCIVAKAPDRDSIAVLSIRGKTLQISSQDTLWTFVQLVKAVSALRSWSRGVRGVCCFGRKNTGKSTALNELFGLEFPTGYHRNAATLFTRFATVEGVTVIDFPGEDDDFAAPATPEFAMLGSALQHALVVVDVATINNVDSRVMQRVAKEFDPDSIFVIINKADTKDKNGKLAVDEIGDVHATVVSHFKFIGVELRADNLVLTTFASNHAPIGHRQFVNKAVAKERVLKFIRRQK